MSQHEAFLLNIALFSVIPLYLATTNGQTRTISFHIYNCAVLVIGGLAGSLYSFALADGLVISGGNIAFGAFMMNTVMLIIIERNTETFRNMIRFVVLVNVFIFIVFNFISAMLASDIALNPLDVSPKIFNVTLWVLVLGGILIVFELLMLLFVFTQVRRWVSNVSLISIIYTFAFILVMCLDGVLFPLLAFGFSSQLSEMIVGNVIGKLILSLCFSAPMLLFYILFKSSLVKFLQAPLPMKDLMIAPRHVLLEELHHYEVRDKQLQEEKEALLELSFHDSLTSLYNKRKYDEVLESEWLRCKRTGSELTLVVGDVDFFKDYNDSYGHSKGDECLKEIAILWANAFKRPADLAARIGGEEFSFILPDTLTEHCLQNLEHLMQLLANKNIPHNRSLVAPYVTMSLGIATMVPEQDRNPSELFDLADRRLYKAKENGRNRIVAS